MQENWLVIKEFPNYEVSEYGRVRRCAVSVIGRGKIGKIIKPDISKNGYVRVCLCRDGQPYRRLVHRLVLQAFVGPPPSKDHEAAHLDGKRSSNHVSNLVWSTRSENNSMKKIHGTALIGRKNPNALLNEDQAKEIFISGLSSFELEKRYPVSARTIRAIKSKQNWKSIHREVK